MALFQGINPMRRFGIHDSLSPIKKIISSEKYPTSTLRRKHLISCLLTNGSGTCTVLEFLLMIPQKGVLTAGNPKGIVRSKQRRMEKPEESSESESSLDKVRAAKQAAREHEVGYKTGQAIGKQLRSSHILMLPIQMALAPVLATLGGRWLDGYLGTSPGFTLGGLAFGLAVAALSLVRTLKEQKD